LRRSTIGGAVVLQRDSRKADICAAMAWKTAFIWSAAVTL
jgi:hypothetical protein